MPNKNKCFKTNDATVARRERGRNRQQKNIRKRKIEPRKREFVDKASAARLLNINEVNGCLHQIICSQFAAPRNNGIMNWSWWSGRRAMPACMHPFPLLSAHTSSMKNVESSHMNNWTRVGTFYVRKIISRVVNSRIECAPATSKSWWKCSTRATHRTKLCDGGAHFTSGDSWLLSLNTCLLSTARRSEEEKKKNYAQFTHSTDKLVRAAERLLERVARVSASSCLLWLVLKRSSKKETRFWIWKQCRAKQKH